MNYMNITCKANSHKNYESQFHVCVGVSIPSVTRVTGCPLSPAWVTWVLTTETRGKAESCGHLQ